MGKRAQSWTSNYSLMLTSAPLWVHTGKGLLAAHQPRRCGPVCILQAEHIRIERCVSSAQSRMSEGVALWRVGTLATFPLVNLKR